MGVKRLEVLHKPDALLSVVVINVIKIRLESDFDA